MGLKKWFFTFGQGALYQEYYVEVFAPSYMAARDTMLQYYGHAWSKQYTREEWFKPFFTIVGEYHLSHLETLISFEDS